MTGNKANSTFSVAAVGDIIINQPIYEEIRRQCPQLLALLNEADVVVGNYEGSVIDMREFEGWPQAESGFGWLISDPRCAGDLHRMGFNMMSRANNHSVDWGVAGMRMTDRLLSEAGLVCAGTGGSMAAARAPAYLFGPAGRTGLVSFATTFERNAPAGDAYGTVAARPGASTLGLTPFAMVCPEHFAVLKAIRDAQPAGSIPQLLLDIDARAGMVTLYGLFGQHFKCDPNMAAGDTVRIHYEMDALDLRAILLNIRQASQSGDFTIAAQHTHEPSNWSAAAPLFMQDVAKQAIDNGADMVCGHGPHQLRGVEIYKGKPIFYSLGNFCFMYNTQQVLTRDEWERRIWQILPGPSKRDPDSTTPAEFLEWTRAAGAFGESIWFESVIAVSRYEAGVLHEVELHPIELNWAGRDADRGIPRLAAGDKALGILERLRCISLELGTVIEIDSDRLIGIVRNRRP